MAYHPSNAANKSISERIQYKVLEIKHLVLDVDGSEVNEAL